MKKQDDLRKKGGRKEDRTHIAMILDRSGSMEGIKDDAIGGFNSFVKEQRVQPGEASLTLVQFDSQDPYEIIHDMKPVAGIPLLDDKTYVPRASTPLLDAIGRGINDLSSNLAKMDDEAKPGKIVFAVITDGQENASREFSRDDIVRMIGEKEKEGWQFVFLSADMAAISDAAGYGFKGKATMAFDKSGRGIKLSCASLSKSISEYRRNEKQDVSFDDEDRKKQKAETR